MNPPEPRTYPEGEPLPECGACHERSYDSRRCLNPDCPSHSACEGCGEREGIVWVQTETGTEDRLCLSCVGQAVRAILAGGAP